MKRVFATTCLVTAMLAGATPASACPAGLHKSESAASFALAQSRVVRDHRGQRGVKGGGVKVRPKCQPYGDKNCPRF